MMGVLKKYVVSIVLIFSAAAAANPRNSVEVKSSAVGQLNFDFGAPVVSDLNDVSDKRIGMIVYDLSSGQFMGYNSVGTWDEMTIQSQTQIVTNGSGERIERATITNNGTAAIVAESGDWLVSATRNSAGKMTVVIQTGMFSSAPTCLCSVPAPAVARVCNMDTTSTPTATQINTFTFVSNTGSANDNDITLVCMGPRP